MCLRTLDNAVLMKFVGANSKWQKAQLKCSTGKIFNMLMQCIIKGNRNEIGDAGILQTFSILFLTNQT